MHIKLGKREGKPRGQILDGNTEVFPDLPMPYTVQEIPFNVTVGRSFVAYEGTYIRVYKHDGVWYLSTFRRIDARTSKWGNCEKSFGDIFPQRVGGLSSLVPNLNPDHKYLFQITYPHGYGGVCTATDKVYHIGTFINGEFDFDDTVRGTEKPEEISPINILNTLDKSTPETAQGIIAYTKDLTSYKILSEKYMERTDYMRFEKLMRRESKLHTYAC